MYAAALRGIVGVVLVLPGLGCQSVYRFRCTSKPSGAGVLIGQEMMGETPCNIKIPKKSGLIQDGKIEFTFCPPDGREKKRIVDLHDLKPTNPAALVAATPFLVAGVGLLALTFSDRDKDDSAVAEESQSKNVGGKAITALAGLGVMGIGAGVYALLGGHTSSLSDYPVRVDFTEPEDGGGRQIPSPVQKEDGSHDETAKCGAGE